MSHDQKPGKVRVVHSGAPPARRQGDGAPTPASGTGAAPAAAEAAAPKPKSGMMLAALLFVLGSAAGGVAQALLL